MSAAPPDALADGARAADRRALLRRRGRAARAAVPRDGRALRARRAAARARRARRRTRSDARHVAVEFVHPVIVGKRALPALALAARAAGAEQLALLAEPDDIVIGLRHGRARRRRARARLPDDRLRRRRREWELAPPATTRSSRQELVETLYHVLWELVHVFFEHRGLLAGRDAAAHDAARRASSTRSSASARHDLEAVLADVRRSVAAQGGARSARCARRR